MKILVNVSEAVISKVRRDWKKESALLEIINSAIHDHLYYNSNSGEYDNGAFFATLTETIEPIGYRINVSKSPTPEERI